MNSWISRFQNNKNGLGQGVIGLFLALCVVVLFRTAWVTEDAYITFRPIENFVNGYGPVYNVGERVQAYTHPLWFLLQSLLYAINLKLFGISFSEHLYFLNIFLSLAISILVVILYAYWGGRGKNWPVMLALTVIACSKAFMEYSTSGLENPLSHLLILIFLLLYLQDKEIDAGRFFLLSLIASMAILNRFDLLLVFLPVLVVVWWQLGRKLSHLFYLVFGFLPLISWMFFSLVYYGFLFPNTAYAKLNTGESLLEKIASSANYYVESLIHDPITLTFIIVVLVFVLIKGNHKYKIAAAGLVLYLAYIFYIGGDYMSGRFFSVPLIIAAILLLGLDIPGNWVSSTGIILVLALGMILPRSPLLSPLDYGRKVAKAELLYKGIADHRAENYAFTGLMAARRGDAGSRHAGKEWNYLVNQVAYIESGPAGQQMYQWGPNVHLVDRNGLVDALIARIPHTESRRPGHFWRTMPDGYLESLESGENLIVDPDLATYYDHLLPVISGPIFSRARLQEIWRFNSGYYDGLMQQYVSRVIGAGE